MVLLTAYNQDAQNFILKHDKPNRHTKRRILENIEQSVIASGVSFEKLFPPKSKRLAVLDEIVYYLSGSGICKVSAATLAENVGASIRTVFDAVKNIKKTEAFIVAGMADGKNKYIFVLKSHPNFKIIMKDVFFIENAEQITGHIAEQKNAVPVETVSIEGQKTGFNSFNSFNSLQEKEIIQQAIENDLQDSNQNHEKTRGKLQQYHANEYQLMLFDNIMAFPFPESIKQAAGTVALRVGMDCNAKRVHQALKLLWKMGLNMMDGVDIKNVVAVFSEGMASKRYLSSKVVKPAPAQPQIQKPKFYNWLEDRS